MKPLSMAESSKYIKTEELVAFIRQFSKIDNKDAAKLREEIEKLGSMKIKEEDTSKVIDILPEDAQDVAKIFTDVSLDEKEANQILEIVKKYR